MTSSPDGHPLTSVLRWFDSEANIETITDDRSKKSGLAAHCSTLISSPDVPGGFLGWLESGQPFAWPRCFTWSVCLPSPAFTTAIFRIKLSKPTGFGNLFLGPLAMHRFNEVRSGGRPIIAIITVLRIKNRMFTLPVFMDSGGAILDG